MTKPSISRSLRLKLGVHPRLAAADPVFSGVAAAASRPLADLWALGPAIRTIFGSPRGGRWAAG